MHNPMEVSGLGPAAAKFPVSPFHLVILVNSRVSRRVRVASNLKIISGTP